MITSYWDKYIICPLLHGHICHRWWYYIGVSTSYYPLLHNHIFHRWYHTQISYKSPTKSSIIASVNPHSKPCLRFLGVSYQLKGITLWYHNFFYDNLHQCLTLHLNLALGGIAYRIYWCMIIYPFYWRIFPHQGLFRPHPAPGFRPSSATAPPAPRSAPAASPWSAGRAPVRRVRRVLARRAPGKISLGSADINGYMLYPQFQTQPKHPYMNMLIYANYCIIYIYIYHMHESAHIQLVSCCLLLRKYRLECTSKYLGKWK